MTQRNRILGALVAAGILFLYIGSETVLRRFVFKPASVKPGENVTLKSVLNALPVLLRVPLEHQIKIQALREKAAKAQKPAERIKSTYELARELSLRRQLTLYARLVTEHPDHPDCTAAFVALVKDGRRGHRVADFVAFADRCPAEKRAVVFRSGWPAFTTLDREARWTFLQELRQRRILDAGLETAYSDMVEMALLRNDPTTGEAARQAQEECHRLAREQLARQRQPSIKK